jgi:hypothetical protein
VLRIYPNEVSIAYSGGANSDIISTLVNGMFTGKQVDYWGPISCEYFRYISNNRLAVGGIAVLSGYKWDDLENAKSTFFTVMPAVKYKWLNASHFAMYSKVAAGLLVMSDSGNLSNGSSTDKTRTAFNWQVSALGVEFGSSFRGFVELGMGEQGIILGGLRYKI